MRLWLSRWVTSGVEENLRRCSLECERAAASGAELVVDPRICRLPAIAVDVVETEPR